MKKNLILINCNIRNTKSDCGLIKNAAIMVNNQEGISKINYIGSCDSIPISDDYDIVDLKGKYVLPGLINAHCHLFGSGKPIKSISNEFSKNLLVKILNFPLTKIILHKIMKNNVLTELSSGVTTIRTLGDFHNLDVKIKNEIANRRMIGPQLVTAGRGITIINGHASEYALNYKSLDEAKDCVKKCITNGVDVIKIFSTGGVLEKGDDEEIGQIKMGFDEVKAICEEAHAAGLMVTSHVVCKKGMKEALLAGVDTIEHGAEMDDEIVELFKNNPRTLRGYSSLVPTIYPAVVLSELSTVHTKISDTQREKARIVLQRIIKGFRRAVEEGIKVGLGNDASVPFVTHYDLWREIDVRIKFAGISAIEALYQATYSNAEILGVDTYTGSIDLGKRADFLVLDGDPVQDISNLSKPQMVITDGHIISDLEVKRYADIDGILNSITLN